MYDRNDLIKAIESKSADLQELASNIWDNPELAFTEYKSAAYLCDALRKEGFEVSISARFSVTSKPTFLRASHREKKASKSRKTLPISRRLSQEDSEAVTLSSVFWESSMLSAD